MKYCCDYFKMNYEFGIKDVKKVPSIKNPSVYEEHCSNCGRKVE